jgi:integrase
MTHLTEAVVKRLPRPKQGNRIAYDDMARGFGCRVTAAGARSYVLNYTTKGGRERRITIGDCNDWAATAARAKARDLRREIDNGGDPLADIEAEREAPTVVDLIERFEAEHLPRKRPGTAADYQRMIRNHIRPHFGKHVKVADVAHDDVQRLHDKITKAGHLHRANRVIAVLSKAFNLACRWDMRTDNPCKGIERNIEHHRRRYLSGDELVRLIKALAEHPDQQAANIIRLLLLTGARRGEVLSMRWADVDLSSGVWSKLPSSTKQKEHHQAPLSAPARQLLSEIRDGQASKHPKKPLGEFVFPSLSDSGHLEGFKRSWRTMCKAAGITGLRIHDLRHSYASQAISGGANLALVGALLGHSNPSTTARYAHLHHDPMREATERVGAIIAGAGQPTQEPAKLRRGG